MNFHRDENSVSPVRSRHQNVPLKPSYLHWSIGNAAKFNFIDGRPSLGILWLSKVVLCCNKVNFVIKVNNFVGKVVLLLAK